MQTTAQSSKDRHMESVCVYVYVCVSVDFPGTDNYNNITGGNSLRVQWLGLSAFTAGAQVRFLVWELRSHKQRGAVQKKKKDNWK